MTGPEVRRRHAEPCGGGLEPLTCPTCQTHHAMRSYERSGVMIDQCSDCRGILLDRGELEHLIDADATFRAAQVVAPPPVSSSPAPDPGYH